MRLNGILLESVGCPLMTGQLCRIESANHTLIDAQAVGFNRDITYLMPFKQPVGLMAGARVFPEEKAHDILIGESWLGRVVNGLGEPLDGKGRLNGNDLLPPLPPSVNPLTRRSVDEPLDVGVKAINGLLTIGKGQRVGLMAGSGVGKSVLLGMITRQTKADIVVVGLIGERGREVKEFIDHSLGADGLAKSIVVVAPADESPLMRLKATELCHSIAAWFRDRGHHVLLLVDSLTRYAMAQREIALSLGEPPATKGYPPSAFGMIDLPLSDMYTPYVFPSENGLRCGTRELNYGPHQWRGDFQFNISRYSQQQLMETSHRHLLHAEEGTWLNIDGFHMGIGGDDSWSPSVSAEFQLSAGRYHYQLVWCQK